MADVTISSLTNKLPGSSAVFPYSEGGVTYNATLNQIIPTGVIMMWSGSIASVPSGWALCNGANGTPDLRDRFIVGAGNTYGVSSVGGSETVTLSVNQMPSHNHQDNSWFDRVAYDATYPFNTSRNGIAATRTAGGTWSNVGGNGNNNAGVQTYNFPSGGGQAHENRPPYYALAYIIKL